MGKSDGGRRADARRLLWTVAATIGVALAVPAVDGVDARAQATGWAVPGTVERVELVLRDGAAPLADEQILVTLTPSRIDYSEADPAALHFVDSTGTRLDHEVERWNEDGTSSVWVRVPDWSDPRVQSVWLYYGGDVPGAQSPEQVWGPDALLVHHFEEQDGTLIDSSGGNADADPEGSPGYAVPGRVGPALAFDGVDDRVDLGYVADGESRLSVSGWVRLDATPTDWMGVVARDVFGGSAPGEVFFLGASAGQWYARIKTAGSGLRTITATAQTGWHHLAFTYDGSQFRLYVNGEPAGSTPARGALDSGVDGGAPLVLGSYSNGGGFFSGALDELRISRDARSAASIAHEASNAADETLVYLPPETTAGELGVALTSPVEGAVVSDADSVTLAGFLNRPAEVAYRLDGGPAVPVSLAEGSRRFEVTVPGLRSGDHELTVVATDGDDPQDRAEASVRFSVSGALAPTAPGEPLPADGTVGAPLGVDLSVAVADPTSDPLDVTFLEAAELAFMPERDSARAGVASAAPADAVAPAADEAAVAGEARALAAPDGELLTTTTTRGYPYQRFSVRVDEQPAAGQDLVVRWRGRSDRRVTLYAWSRPDARWVDIGSGYESDGEFEVTGSLDPETMLEGRTAQLLAFRGLTAPPEAAARPRAGEYDFTFAWMTDTQFLSESYPSIFDSMTSHVAASKDALDIRYLAHTGDLVQTWNVRSQWEVASAKMAILESAGVPYGVLPGNHDNGSSGAADRHALYYEFFGEQRFAAQPHYGGSYKDNENHYDLIDADGLEFVIVHLGWWVDADEREWARDVLAEHSDRIGIVATHEYLDTDGDLSTRTGTDFDPQRIREEVVIPSPNVVMVINGHLHGAAHNVLDLGDRKVVEILHDYQEGPEGGSGYLRYLQFDADNGLLYVNTYSPYTDDWSFYDDARDQFVEPIALGAEPSERTLATDQISLTVPTSREIATAAAVTGERAEARWEGLRPDTSHSWYATVRDPAGNVVASDVWSFRTAPNDDGGEGPPPPPPGLGDPRPPAPPITPPSGEPDRGRGRGRLVLRTSTSRRRVRAGARSVLTIRVRNASRSPMRAVVVCDRLPRGLVRVRSRPATRKAGARRFCWRPVRLRPGQARTYRIVTRAVRGRGTRSVQHRVTASSPDARTTRSRRQITLLLGGR